MRAIGCYRLRLSNRTTLTIVARSETQAREKVHVLFPPSVEILGLRRMHDMKIHRGSETRSAERAREFAFDWFSGF